jgi:hypothetical protein
MFDSNELEHSTLGLIGYSAMARASTASTFFSSSGALFELLELLLLPKRQSKRWKPEAAF